MRNTKHMYQKGEELIVLVNERGEIVDKLTVEKFVNANINLENEERGRIF